MQKNNNSRLRLVDTAIVPLADFELFWEIYPRKKAKLDALKAWNQVKAIMPAIEHLIAAIHSQIQSGDWNDPRYIPYPATWLRAGQWDDE